MGGHPPAGLVLGAQHRTHVQLHPRYCSITLIHDIVQGLQTLGVQRTNSTR